MAGLIYLSEERQWPVAGWVFDHALRLIRRHLPMEPAARILEEMEQAEASSLGYLSLEDYTPAELSLFRDALERAYAEARAGGGESFANPDFYEGFMARLEELLEIVREPA